MRSCGSDGRKVTSATADEADTRGRHRARREQGGKKGGRWGWEGAEPLGVGGNSGGRQASGVDPEPYGAEGAEGGREASGVEENYGRGRQEVGGGGGVESSPDNSTPNGRGGESNHGRVTRLQKKKEEESSCHGTT